MTQVIEFYHEISNYGNDRKQVDTVFIDVSKAFDRAPPRKLAKALINLFLMSTDGLTHIPQIANNSRMSMVPIQVCSMYTQGCHKAMF